MLITYPIKTIQYAYKRFTNSYIKPLFINFLLTYRCNARCSMCNIWVLYAEEPHLADKELSADDIEKFILDNRSELSELRNIGLTGGDPLLMRKDFVGIVRLIKRLLPEAHLGVQTNGLIPELASQRLGEIVSFYPDFSLAVSLDGIGEAHSQIRGITASFQKASETIKRAQGLGIKNITCGMTLNKDNYRQIKQLKIYVEGLNAEFSCFLAENADYFNNKSNCYTDEQIKEITAQLKKVCGYHYFMDNLRLLLEGARRRRLPCFSGFTSLVIDPYGNVKPCILKVKGLDDDVFGNIKERPLKDMLTSYEAKLIKDKIKKCSCWCQCEVSTSVVVAPFDALNWFVFRCPDKRGFLGHVLNKKNKYSELL